MSFAEIDEERKKQGLTILELTRRAGVAPSTYWFLRKSQVRVRRSTLEKLWAGLSEPARLADPLAPVRGAYRGQLAFAASALGFDPDDVSERPTAREYWRARAVAMANTAADLNLGSADLARALGLSKQIVHWNIKQAAAMDLPPPLARFTEKSGRVMEADA